MMSTERLKNIHRQEQNQRKFVCVMNDVAKSQQDLYNGYIEKEKHESAQKSDKSIVVTRRNIVRQRVLKKCMTSKREEVERSNAKKLFGRYHGVPVEQIAGQIDNYLEKNHPKLRRRRKIDELFQEGYDKGAILDTDTIKNKVHDYFDKPLVEIQHSHVCETRGEKKSEESDLNATFPVFSKPFYTGNFQTSTNPPVQNGDETKGNVTNDEEGKERLFVKRKVSKFLNEDVPDNLSVHSEAPVEQVVTRNRGIRPLTLPPIKLGTDQDTERVQSKRKSKQNSVNCITDLIDRIHKAKEKREKETKLNKERRAKRLQHERVFGIENKASSTIGANEEPPGDLFSDWDKNPWRHEEKRSSFIKHEEKRFTNGDVQLLKSGLKLPSIQN